MHDCMYNTVIIRIVNMYMYFGIIKELSIKYLNEGAYYNCAIVISMTPIITVVSHIPY